MHVLSHTHTADKAHLWHRLNSINERLCMHNNKVHFLGIAQFSRRELREKYCRKIQVLLRSQSDSPHPFEKPPRNHTVLLLVGGSKVSNMSFCSKLPILLRCFRHA